jgi:hypothetical protein
MAERLLGSRVLEKKTFAPRGALTTKRIETGMFGRVQYSKVLRLSPICRH